MDPDARLLRYFLAVADELNFTRAAERLHIAQPSLSAQIRQLESQLGVPLLHRSTRSVSLTAAGQALQSRGPGALTGLEQAWQAARDTGHGRTGTLRLAYPLSAGHDTVPQLLDAIHHAYPDIAVSTDVLPTPQVLLAVRDGLADAGIGRSPAPLDGVRLRPLRRDPEGILAAATHPLAASSEVGLRDVTDYPVVLHPRSANPEHYDFIRNLFQSRDLHPHFLERDIAFDLSQRLISDGTAVALVGRSTTVRLPPDLRWVPLAEQVTVTVTLVLPAGQHPPTAERFREIALSHATSQGWID